MNITKDIVYVGVNDRDIDLFEGKYIVPNGMSYNSYVIFDESIAVMDTVDARFGEEWIANLRGVLKDRTPSFLIIQHMEPDHSANIVRFMEEFPEDAMDNRRQYITDFYLQGKDNLDREFPYLKEAEMDAFVEGAALIILDTLHTNYCIKL